MPGRMLSITALLSGCVHLHGRALRCVLSAMAPGLVMALACMHASAAAPLREVEVIVFAGTNAMPSYVAQEKGFFAREGLAVNITATPNSGFQISSLVAGRFHVASTAIDNLIAYQEGQGTAKLDREPDLVAFMGISSAELSLFAIPGVRTIADLKGRELALDSLSTGYAFVLRHMLEKAGLGPADFRFVAVGNSRARLQSLRDAKFAAALITEPFTGVARDEGFTLLGEAAARSSVEGMTRGQSAIQRNGEMDLQGLHNVIMLRERYGQPPRKMGPASKYYDPYWFDRARARP